MKNTLLAAGLLVGLTPLATAPVAAQTTTTTKYITVDGEVLRYEAGRTIVIRGADNKEMVYTLTPSFVMPMDVKVGRRVTLYTEPGINGGTQVVTRVTTTSVTPEGNLKRVTEDTRTLPSGATTTKYVTVDGEVLRYEAGKTIVIRGSDNKEMMYTLTPSFVMPMDVKVGRRVTLYTEPGMNGGTQVVTRVTTTSVTPEGNVKRVTEDTRTLPSGATTTKYVTVDGEVLRYEAGKTIVIRGADNKEMMYTLTPSFVMPTDVKVGRHVTLYTEPAAMGGTQVVSRVTTTSVTPEGNVKSVTEDTRTLPSGATTTTTTTRISGRVDAYEPGKTLTITRADGTQATYIINGTSSIPTDLMIGKTISIVPSASGDMVVQTITYVPIKK
ncbi:MAG: hypothetical protein ABIR28_07225 [Vicinamibacteria bacterium]